MSSDPLPPDAPTVALLPWGDVFEDYLDPIGMSFDTFAAEASGGWLFGYVEALHTTGVRTVVICVSRTAAGAPGGIVRRIHEPTGASIYALAPSVAYGPLRRAGGAATFAVAPYLATPLLLLARVLRNERCTAILCQEYEYPRFDACVLLGRLLRLPVFATFQGGNGFGATRSQRMLRPLTLRRSNGICIASAQERVRVRARYRLPQDHIAAIPNPLTADVLPTPEERVDARRGLGVPWDARVIVWHGRVERYRKGIDVLMESWKRLCDRHPHPESLHLRLLGTGVEADWLHSEIERAPRRAQIHWTNRFVQDRQEIRRHLAAGDVYLFPSRHEGFALAPMEAMMAGLPVVASAMAPGVSDLMGVPNESHGRVGGGILVPGDDAEDYVRALLRLLGDAELRAELGRWARRRIETAYSPAKVGRDLRRWLFPREPAPETVGSLCSSASVSGTIAEAGSA